MKKTTINIQHEANIKAEGKLHSKKCRPVICIDTGDTFTSVTDAAEYAECTTSTMVVHLQGKTRQVKGKHYCYLSSVKENLDPILTRLRETAAVEDAAKKWMAYEAEQEAIRAAEAKRAEEERKAREELEAKIVKAQEKVARRTAVRDTKHNEARIADERLMEAERELEALQNMLNQ